MFRGKVKIARWGGGDKLYCPKRRRRFSLLDDIRPRTNKLKVSKENCKRKNWKGVVCDPSGNNL